MKEEYLCRDGLTRSFTFALSFIRCHNEIRSVSSFLVRRTTSIESIVHFALVSSSFLEPNGWISWRCHCTRVTIVQSMGGAHG